MTALSVGDGLTFLGSDGVSPGDLLLDGLGVCLGEQIEHGAAEVVSVAVRVAQLIGDRVQEQVTP